MGNHSLVQLVDIEQQETAGKSPKPAHPTLELKVVVYLGSNPAQLVIIFLRFLKDPGFKFLGSLLI